MDFSGNGLQVDSKGINFEDEELEVYEGFGRAGEIRTRGLLHPKQARYQAAPQPDNRCSKTILTAMSNSRMNYYQVTQFRCQKQKGN